MVNYEELTKKNMEEYSKAMNAIAQYIRFLKTERNLPDGQIRDIVFELGTTAIIQNCGNGVLYNARGTRNLVQDIAKAEGVELQ